MSTFALLEYRPQPPAGGRAGRGRGAQLVAELAAVLQDAPPNVWVLVYEGDRKSTDALRNCKQLRAARKEGLFQYTARLNGDHGEIWARDGDGKLTPAETILVSALMVLLFAIALIVGHGVQQHRDRACRAGSAVMCALDGRP